MSKGKPRPAYGLRRPGAGPAGGGGMMGQLQRLQDERAKAQQRLEEETVEVTVGGGVIKAVMNGQQKLLSIIIAPEAVDPEDVEMLQDMILAAVNEAALSASLTPVLSRIKPRGAARTTSRVRLDSDRVQYLSWSRI